MSIVSLVTGILSILLSCCYLGIPLGAAGLITGYLSKKQNAESGGMQQGDGLALAGMICGGIGALLGLIHLALVILGVAVGSFN